MDAVKRIRKRQSASSTSTSKEIGRPSEWPDHYLQVLIVLRLCGLHLTEILQLLNALSDGAFKPKLRNSQLIIRKVLSKGYQDFCTTDTETLRTRVRCTKLFKLPNINPGPRDGNLSYNETDYTETRSATSNTNSMVLNMETHRIAIRSPHMQTNDSSLNMSCDHSTSYQTDSYHVQTRNTCMESSNHPISKESDTMSISISSKRSTRTTSIASYKDTFRNILRRESRTPSCISEIVSLLGRFSLQESRSSICHSVLQTSDQNDPTIGEIFPSQSVLEPQLLGFEDIPLHQPTNCLSEVLQQHVETVRKPNTALLTTCRGCLETNDCIHQEIIRATLSVTDASITLPLMLRSDRTTCVYTEADCYGNNALFFAARTAAPLSVLLQIIENTLDLNALNNDGHNLLFVLDPHGFNVSISESLEFLTLINRLEQRQFNFDHLDYNGQSFLVLLCLRPCFRMSWITLLFEQGQTWQRRIEVLAQQKDSAGNYLVRYLTENPDLRILHPNVLSIISSPKNMNKQSYKDRTILHEQVVQHLVTYALEFPEQRPTELPMYAFEWDGCNINGYDDERHTPLTLFLTKALHGASRISRNFVISQIQELVKLGANINYRCLNGDTLLHIAARKSDFQIMNYLTASGIYVNHQNNEGLRAIDCLAVVVCATAKPSMSGRTTSTIANLRCSFLLLRHGSMSCSMLT